VILLIALVATLSALPGSVPVANATVASSTLDPTFGSGGISNITVPVSREGVAGAAVVQPDGKLVLAGGSKGSIVAEYLAVTRLNTDGSPDPTFGVNGRVLIDRGFPSTADAYTMVFAAAIDPVGRIVLAGVQPAASGARAMIMRLLPDGRIDATFGTGGQVVLAVGPPPFSAYATSVDPLADGRLIVGGSGFVTRLNLM